jgi:hypothetical protein
MHIQILDKVVKFKETSMKGLFKIFVSDKEEEESIPLLIEDHQIKAFEKMLLETKFDLNMPFSYFKLIVSGCAQYAITAKK